MPVSMRSANSTDITSTTMAASRKKRLKNSASPSSTYIPSNAVWAASPWSLKLPARIRPSTRAASQPSFRLSAGGVHKSASRMPNPRARTAISSMSKRVFIQKSAPLVRQGHGCASGRPGGGGGLGRQNSGDRRFNLVHEQTREETEDQQTCQQHEIGNFSQWLCGFDDCHPFVRKRAVQNAADGPRHVNRANDKRAPDGEAGDE